MLLRFEFMRSSIYLSFAVIFLLISSSAFAAQGKSDEGSNSDDGNFLKPKGRTGRHYIAGTSLTEDTLALAKMLEIDRVIEDLKSVVSQAGSDPNQESLVRIMFLRQKCERAIQFASLDGRGTRKHRWRPDLHTIRVFAVLRKTRSIGDAQQHSHIFDKRNTGGT